MFNRSTLKRLIWYYATIHRKKHKERSDPPEQDPQKPEKPEQDPPEK